MLPTNSGLHLVLASTSRYRKDLLSRLTIPFDIAVPDVDETPLPRELPAETALRLARNKAHAVVARFSGALIIGSDQVADCEGVRLDKPMEYSKAVLQLRHLSGKKVVFQTAVVLLNARTGAMQGELVPTEVQFRTLQNAEIERYLQAEPAYDCAGSAKSEGLGIALIDRIQSCDPTALIGLPLIALSQMLRNEKIAIP